MKLIWKFFGKIDECSNNSLFYYFSQVFGESCETEIKSFIVLGNCRNSIEEKENLEELKEEFVDSDGLEDVSPVVHSFVKYSHHCKQIMRFLFVVSRPTSVIVYYFMQKMILSTNPLSCY